MSCLAGGSALSENGPRERPTVAKANQVGRLNCTPRMGSILRASQPGNGGCSTELQQATSVPLGTGPGSHSNINVTFQGALSGAYLGYC